MTPNEIPHFVTWLQVNGADILKPTSEWEALRYKHDGCLVVVYQKKNGSLTVSKAANAHFKAFKAKTDIAAIPVKKTPRPGKNSKQRMIGKLRERDDNLCFFCGQFHPETLEHLLPVSHGGNNKPENLALAHAPCNVIAGNLGIVAKVRLRDAIREEAAQVPPWEFFDPSQSPTINELARSLS